MCSISAADNCVHDPMAIKSINLLLFQIKIVGLLRQIINIKCVVFIVFIVETNEIQCFISANYSSMLTLLIKCATITLYYIKIKIVYLKQYFKLYQNVYNLFDIGQLQMNIINTAYVQFLLKVNIIKDQLALMVI